MDRKQQIALMESAKERAQERAKALMQNSRFRASMQKTHDFVREKTNALVPKKA